MNDKPRSHTTLHLRPVIAMHPLIVRTIFVISLVIATPLSARADITAPPKFDLALPLMDPLSAEPARLQNGATLPGDAGALLCPVAYDLSQPLGMPQAVDLALCNNPKVAAAWANIKVQAAALGETRAAYFPTLSGATSRVEYATRYPNPDLTAFGTQIANEFRVNSTFTLNAAWRLLDFGGRDANRLSADALLQAAQFNHDAELQRTLAVVIGAYYDAQTARAAWQAKEKSAVLALQTKETAERREKLGAGSRAETLQASTTLARTALERNRAQGQYEKSRAALVAAMGIAPGTALNLAQDLSDSSERVRKALNDWITEAQTRHPALLAAREQVHAASQKVTAVRSEGLPSMDLTSAYYQNGRPGFSPTLIRTHESIISLTVNFPLFEGFGRTYKVRGAEAQVTQREADLRDVEQQIMSELAKAHAEAESGFDNLEASRLLLESAEAALQTVQRKYERGAADIIEMLNALTALADAQQERVRCSAEWRSARLRLFASAGALGRLALNPQGGF